MAKLELTNILSSHILELWWKILIGLTRNSNRKPASARGNIYAGTPNTPLNKNNSVLMHHITAKPVDS